MKPLAWIGSSFKDFGKLPELVRDEILGDLQAAQDGDVGDHAEQMKGDLRDVMEIRVNGPAGTYRSMYTTRIGSKVYVLHAFQKKSKTGIATPKRDLDLIRKRLKVAREAAKAEKL